MNQAGTVHLRKTRAPRVQHGHPWVFSNEVASVDGHPEAGDVVTVALAGGEFLGRGFYHPNSLIAVRILTRDPEEEVDSELFRRRLSQALAYRRQILPEASSYRLVHGEGDFLPGLVVDCYGPHLVLQAFSAGMDRRRDDLAGLLEELLSARSIAERSDSPLRDLEGLPRRSGMLRGEAPGPVTVDEDGVHMQMDLLGGQKTGAFLDQRENRRLIRRHARDRRVLDVYCHDGGFGLQAAAGGAQSVLAVDVSEDSLGRAMANAETNGFQERLQVRRGDGVAMLRKLHAEQQRFDLVILDPPSFTRSRKHVPQARRAYRELHRAALAVLEAGGMLATASCSHHIREDTFFETVVQASHESGRQLQWVARGMQSPDHPVLLDVPETSYLKFGLFRCAGRLRGREMPR
jgi:23S rRNA (cytosine1962-C5)-methyltransferase